MSLAAQHKRCRFRSGTVCGYPALVSKLPLRNLIDKWSPDFRAGDITKFPVEINVIRLVKIAFCLYTGTLTPGIDIVQRAFSRLYLSLAELMQQWRASVCCRIQNSGNRSNSF